MPIPRASGWRWAALFVYITLSHQHIHQIVTHHIITHHISLQCYPTPDQAKQLQAASELVPETVEYTQSGYEIHFPNIYVPAYGVVLLNIYQ